MGGVYADVAVLNRALSVGLTEKMTVEQRPKRCEVGRNPASSSGRANAKALRWKCTSDIKVGQEGQPGW